jgi:hypothetical protein
MPVIATPLQATYNVGNVVDVDFTSGNIFPAENDQLELYIFDAITGGGTYSDLLDTQLCDAAGEARFTNMVIPSFSLGPDHYFVVRNIDNANEEDYSDPFTLAAAAAGGTQANTKLNLGLSL